jgi:predicted ribosome quality control (RQC) complex YloA/Tae2 family protein
MRAAALAAYHSKKRNDTVCPVTVTPRKYVRKPKGLPDGAVIVEREKVVLVRPADWGEEQ